jgi:guanine deaminase
VDRPGGHLTGAAGSPGAGEAGATPPRATLVRARVMHTPRDPFAHDSALDHHEDGGLAFDGDGRIQAVGDFGDVRRAHPDADLVDASDALLLPGLVDTHVHWPQLGIVGSMGLELLDWLRVRTLPEEARLADPDYARSLARDFVHGLAGNGTTTALVFGSHFPAAQHALFEEAQRSGLRIASGLVVSDRDLLPELRRSPDAAYEAGRELAGRWHDSGRLRYAVSPRFSISCSEGMLESCGALGGELDGALVTSHINENRAEIAAVADWFSWSADYLETYERHGLVGAATVLAHDVHPTDGELERLAAARASVAHCPSSNAFLGSGIFPMRRHLDHQVRFALGSDVGAGTGLSLFKEGLVAYEVQMLAADGCRLTPAHLLWLATRAGAEALGLGDRIGDLSPGRDADFLLLRPPSGGTLAAALRRAGSAEEALGAVFTLAREESVAEVRVSGGAVYTRAG